MIKIKCIPNWLLKTLQCGLYAHYYFFVVVFFFLLLLKYRKISKLKTSDYPFISYVHINLKNIFFLIHPVPFKSIFCLISAVFISWAHHWCSGLICFKYENKQKSDCCGEKPWVLPDPLYQELNESYLFSPPRGHRCALLFQECNVFNASVTKLPQKSFYELSIKCVFSEKDQYHYFIHIFKIMKVTHQSSDNLVITTNKNKNIQQMTDYFLGEESRGCFLCSAQHDSLP